MSDDQAKVNEDYRRLALYRNAEAVMQSVDDQAERISDIVIERVKDRQQVTMLKEEVRVLTQRFDEMFAKLTGTGATDGDFD